MFKKGKWVVYIGPDILVVHKHKRTVLYDDVAYVRMMDELRFMSVKGGVATCVTKQTTEIPHTHNVELPVEDLILAEIQRVLPKWWNNAF